jgi:hypothetical protein
MSTKRLTADMFHVGIVARLMTYRTITDTGCWVWTRAVNDAGYGLIRTGGRPDGWTERVHRVAFALWVGPIECGVRVLHRCDNPPCFNPDHLFTGTAQDNTDDMLKKGRWRQPRTFIGEDGTNAKLRQADVEIVIERLLRGDTRTAIAQDFGVTIGAISRIAVGKNWKHLTVGRGIVKSTRGIKRAVQ